MLYRRRPGQRPRYQRPQNLRYKSTYLRYQKSLALNPSELKSISGQPGSQCTLTEKEETEYRFVSERSPVGYWTVTYNATKHQGQSCYIPPDDGSGPSYGPYGGYQWPGYPPFAFWNIEVDTYLVPPNQFFPNQLAGGSSEPITVVVAFGGWRLQTPSGFLGLGWSYVPPDGVIRAIRVFAPDGTEFRPYTYPNPEDPTTGASIPGGGSGTAGSDSDWTLDGLKCDCPDYAKKQGALFHSPWRSERVGRDWSASRAGAPPIGCKHISCIRRLRNLSAPPSPDEGWLNYLKGGGVNIGTLSDRDIRRLLSKMRRRNDFPLGPQQRLAQELLRRDADRRERRDLKRTRRAWLRDERRSAILDARRTKAFNGLIRAMNRGQSPEDRKSPLTSGNARDSWFNRTRQALNGAIQNTPGTAAFNRKLASGMQWGEQHQVWYNPSPNPAHKPKPSSSAGTWQPRPTGFLDYLKQGFNSLRQGIRYY